MKHEIATAENMGLRRAPHGARGLKLLAYRGEGSGGRSRPAWGAWIETLEGVLRKICNGSRPAWGAWIETLTVASPRGTDKVAPRMGRVD